VSMGRRISARAARRAARPGGWERLCYRLLRGGLGSFYLHGKGGSRAVAPTLLRTEGVRRLDLVGLPLHVKAPAQQGQGRVHRLFQSVWRADAAVNGPRPYPPMRLPNHGGATVSSGQLLSTSNGPPGPPAVNSWRRLLAWQNAMSGGRTTQAVCGMFCTFVAYSRGTGGRVWTCTSDQRAAGG
jgi:hypothetical protein